MLKIPPRILALRIIALAGLTASAALTSDALRPEQHGFCPLEAACAAARSSALGAVLGVPTSGLGLIAFGSLLLVTLLPPKSARKALRPAGLLAAISGAGLVAYQATVLHGFCPLCLVADASGLAAGVAVFGWTFEGRGARGKKGGDGLMASRLRWILAGALAVAAPILWPKPEAKKAWVEIPQQAEIEEVITAGAGTAAAAPRAAPVVPPPESDEFVIPKPRTEPARARPKPSDPTRPVAAPPVETVQIPAAPPRPPPSPEVPPPPPPPPPPIEAPREISIVEYVNAFCTHCRMTHARLDKLLATNGVATKRRRIYVWPAGDPPMWAKMCVCARAQGKEEALFAELLLADEDASDDLWSAAKRAEVDAAALSAAIQRGDWQATLERYHQRVQASRIEGLPTLDIGRRRLQGEQSTEELREAVDAAVADLPHK